MKREKHNISFIQGIYTQSNSILGVSIITYPYTFCELGYILSTIITIFMCIISGFTLYFLAKCSKITGKKSQEDLILGVSGKLGAFLANIIFYLACILPLIFYLNVSAEFYNDTLIYFEYPSNKTLCAIITTIFCTLLCICLPNVEKLEFISIGALFSLLLFIFYVFIDFIYNFNSITFSQLKKFDINYKSLNSISFIIFGYISHSSIISIINCVDTLPNSKWIIIISNIISTFVYLTTGFLGFAVYPVSEKNYLMNGDGNSGIKIALKFFLASVNVLSFPLMMIPARSNIISLINFAVYFETNTIFEIVNIVLNGVLALLVVSYMENMDFLESMFFIIGSFTMFIIPTYLFTKIVKDINLKEYVACIVSLIVSIFGIFMGFKGFYEILCKLK